MRLRCDVVGGSRPPPWPAGIGASAGTAPAAVPDQMPFDIPYGPATPPTRLRKSSPPRWKRPRSRRAIGSWPSRWSIRAATSSTSTRWTRRRWRRSTSRRARPAPAARSGARRAPSSISCRPRPVPSLIARSDAGRIARRLPAGRRRQDHRRDRLAAAPPRPGRRGVQGRGRYRQVSAAEDDGGLRARAAVRLSIARVPIRGFFLRPSRIRMAPTMASTSDTGCLRK